MLIKEKEKNILILILLFGLASFVGFKVLVSWGVKDFLSEVAFDYMNQDLKKGVVAGVASGTPLNPTFPKTAVYTTYNMAGWPDVSIGSRLDFFSKYDMAYIYGADDDHGPDVVPVMRAKNPKQVIMSMGKNGLWFGDPPYFLAYRPYDDGAYDGHTVSALKSGDDKIVVKSSVDMNKGSGECNGLIVDSIDKLRNGDPTLVYELFSCYLSSDDQTINVYKNYTYDEDPDSTFHTSLKNDYPAGAVVLSPLRLSGPGVLANLTDDSVKYNGQYTWGYLADKNVLKNSWWDKKLYDGMFHDFFIDGENLQLKSFGVDFDLNGKDDYSQYSQNDINAKWRYGTERWIKAEQNLMESNYPEGSNLYAFNEGSYTQYYHELIDGFLYEGWQQYTSWGYTAFGGIEMMDERRNLSGPNLMFIEDMIPAKWSTTGKNRFSKMRFGLGTAMLFDNYYGIVYGQTNPGYFNMFWYDEFDTDMGYPVSDPYEFVVSSKKVNKARDSMAYTDNPSITQKDRLWVRFFDYGMVIVNPSGQDQDFYASDLALFSEASGNEYHRLHGGQDPGVNNGQVFKGGDKITLSGNCYPDNSGATCSDLRGDAILLFKKPTTAVTDIYVDNFFNNGSSPGAPAVDLTGSWERKTAKGYLDLEKNNPFWSQSSDRRVITSSKSGEEYDDGYGYHVTRDRNAVAKYVPDIGLEGEYEIYEWHGWDGDTKSSEDEADSVTHKIIISGNETDSIKVDQSDSGTYGEWNLLGTYNLPKGKTSWVEISAEGTSGSVIADAIMFRYTGNTVPPVTVKKRLKTDFNCDGQANIKDLGIMLSKWMVDDPSLIEDYLHSSCSDPKTLNLNTTSSSKNRIDILDVGEMISCWGTPVAPVCFK